MIGKSIDWDVVIPQIEDGNCVPIISNRIVSTSLFGKQDIAKSWSDEIAYPFNPSQTNIPRVAQYVSIETENLEAAKVKFLQFLKRKLVNDTAEASPSKDHAALQISPRDLRRISFSDLAIQRLRVPDLSPDSQHPLSLLSSLNIPIYLTTSYHHLIETALQQVGKDPRTEVYIWNDEIKDNISEKYPTDPDYIPTVDKPLVYHLYGIDDYPASLVLTEDDYLEFLVNIVQDMSNVDLFPSSVRGALSRSLLIMLGYDLQDWDCRVLLQGLIKDRIHRPGNITIQLAKGEDDGITDSQRFVNYLQGYFSQIKFNVYWGDTQTFVEELWQA